MARPTASALVLAMLALAGAAVSPAKGVQWGGGGRRARPAPWAPPTADASDVALAPPPPPAPTAARKKPHHPPFDCCCAPPLGSKDPHWKAWNVSLADSARVGGVRARAYQRVVPAPAASASPPSPPNPCSCAPQKECKYVDCFAPCMTSPPPPPPPPPAIDCCCGPPKPGKKSHKKEREFYERWQVCVCAGGWERGSKGRAPAAPRPRMCVRAVRALARSPPPSSPPRSALAEKVQGRLLLCRLPKAPPPPPANPAVLRPRVASGRG